MSMTVLNIIEEWMFIIHIIAIIAIIMIVQLSLSQGIYTLQK